MTKEKTGLELLRTPFPPRQISKLPKPTRAQTDEVKKDFKKGIRCDICGAWHHPKVVHLDYVGHAALTDRLLDCDPGWNWEPMAVDERGLPAFSKDGLWIKLTVCGVTRFGFGSADGKTGGDAVKEIIGDGLRNAAMRFGAALDLWHKGELHEDEPQSPDSGYQNLDPKDVERADNFCGTIASCESETALNTFGKNAKNNIDKLPQALKDRVRNTFRSRLARLRAEKSDPFDLPPVDEPTEGEMQYAG